MLTENTIVEVSYTQSGYRATLQDGTDVTSEIPIHAMKKAIKENRLLKLVLTKNKKPVWRQVAKNILSESENHTTMSISSIVHPSMTQEELVAFVSRAAEIKPPKLKISLPWWKVAVRTVLRSGNLLVVGPSGCGKTLLATALRAAFNRETDKSYFYINLGATQDPRSTLIGNTHFDKERGTFVSLSYFAQAIQVPNSIILLDEASRAHPEAHNILMTVLDPMQRYLRVDERIDSETIRVADGVSFILTANVGSEYTATRIMDRALLDRCVMLEMTPLNADEEFENLKGMYSDMDEKILRAIADIASATRDDAASSIPKLGTIVSTRMTEQMASMIRDGITFVEAAEVCLYPYFDATGGENSPRSDLMKIVQKFLPTEFDNKKTPFAGGNPAAKTNRRLWAD